MADLVIAEADVIAQDGAQIEHGTYGETITAGQPVYLNTTTREWMLADADAAASAAVAGIALNSGADGQKGSIVVSGPLAVGAVLTVGEAYVVSATAGGIAPISDLLTGDYVTLIGTPLSTSVLYVKRIITGAAKA